MDWTTPRDIRNQLKRLWDRGVLLLDPGDSTYPIRIPLKRPTRREWSSRFDEVRSWIRELEKDDLLDLEWEQVKHRQLGENRAPRYAIIDSENKALKLAGKVQETKRYRKLFHHIITEFPELKDYLTGRPAVLLRHETDWPRLVQVLHWFQKNCPPGVYLRQIDLPGIDTKFIESKKGLLVDCLDAVLPPEKVHASKTGSRNFEARYGLLQKPDLVRFRLLYPEPRLAGLSDLTIPWGDFSNLNLKVKKVFITENDVNGLSFPPMEDSLVIFGLGYGVQRIAEAKWLPMENVYYWGDIDTHGFAILDRLRRHIPSAHSFLMDRQTLLSHQLQWVQESSPCKHDLPNLSPPESALYDDLRFNSLGQSVRLEQERVRFGIVRQVTNEIYQTLPGR